MSCRVTTNVLFMHFYPMVEKNLTIKSIVVIPLQSFLKGQIRPLLVGLLLLI